MSNEVELFKEDEDFLEADERDLLYDITEENTFIPYQPKGSKIISIYRPNTIETKEGLFKPMGDIILDNDINSHKKQKLDDIIPKDKIPINYKFNKEG